MAPQFWFRWLQLVTIGVILFGAILFVMPDVALDVFSLIFYSETGGFQARYPAEANEYIRFIHGDLGVTIVGWMVIVYLVLNGPFRRGEPGSWSMLAVSLTVWFVTGTMYSIYTGFWRNIVFNLLFLSLYAIPLAATRNCFKSKS